MKIGKILLWGAGIGTAIWAAKKFLFKPAAVVADNGSSAPPRTTTSGVRDTTANFSGRKASSEIAAGYVSTAFNGEFPGDSDNEAFDMMTGKGNIVSSISNFFGIGTSSKMKDPNAPKWKEPVKGSCPPGYILHTDPDGSKWCKLSATSAKLIPGAKDKYNKKLADLKAQGLSL